MREVCFLIDRDERIVWADASTSPSALPDSRARWEAIWRHRGVLAAIAHSHPLGPDTFSAEDLSTMAAIDSALGRSLAYVVVSPRRMVPEPWWADLLRLASGMEKTS